MDDQPIINYQNSKFASDDANSESAQGQSSISSSSDQDQCIIGAASEQPQSILESDRFANSSSLGINELHETNASEFALPASLLLPESECHKENCWECLMFEHSARSEYLDPTTLSLQYPENVIVVTKKTAEEFPRLPGEKARFSSILASTGVWNNKASIILDDVAVFLAPGTLAFTTDISMEIVGVKNAGLFFTQKPGILACENSQVSIRNLHLTFQQEAYQKPCKNDFKNAFFVEVQESAHVTLKDVRVSPLFGFAYVTGKESRLTLDRCSVSECEMAFVIDGGQLLMNECRIITTQSDELGGCLERGAKGSITKCHFEGHIKALAGSKLVVRDSHFSGDGTIPGVGLSTESHLVAQNSTWENFTTAFFLMKKSEMRLQKSQVSNCKKAFNSLYSCSIFCTENEFRKISEQLISITKSPDGKVEMKRNTDDAVKMVQVIDPKSKPMDHDFPNLCTIQTKSALDHVDRASFVFSQNIRRDSRKARTAWAAGECSSENVWFNNMLCQYCFELESKYLGNVFYREPTLETRRFKYCSQCHVAYYCSKECQEKDWQFHKLDCKIWKKMKKDQKAGSFPR